MCVSHDCPPDDFRDLRDDGVAERVQLVHPAGIPINHSTHRGFRRPPTCSDSGRLFLSIVASEAFPERQSRAEGVAQVVRALTASMSVPPSRLFRGVTRPPLVARDLVGVGHNLTASTNVVPE